MSNTARQLLLPALVVPAAPLVTALALLMVAGVVALIAWALQLMQAANDRREFALMLAGCMVCSAAVGLAAVMVITFSGSGRLEGRPMLPGITPPEAGVSLDAIVLPWEDSDLSHSAAPG